MKTQLNKPIKISLLLMAVLSVMLLCTHCKDEPAPSAGFSKSASVERILQTMNKVANGYNLQLTGNPFIYSSPQVTLTACVTRQAKTLTRDSLKEGTPLLFFFMSTDENPGTFYRLVLGKTGVMHLYGGEFLTTLLADIKNEQVIRGFPVQAPEFIVSSEPDSLSNQPMMRLGLNNSAVENRGTFAVSGKSSAKVYYPEEVKIILDEIRAQVSHFQGEMNNGFPSLTATQYPEAWSYSAHELYVLYQLAQNDLKGLEMKNLEKNKEYTLMTSYIEKEGEGRYWFRTTLTPIDQIKSVMIRNRSEKDALISEESVGTSPAGNPLTRMQISYEHESWTDGAGHTTSYTYSNFHFDGIHIDNFKADCWWEHK